ncbi:MAG TPA: hypothetical protein VK604_12255, partial [Bryobacteraceae bacterium]|nr:hypothetical protein [Bryobacteraceae bacterium]
MKTSRRRLDVNVEELDRLIDAAENGPLSNADRQKLKTTLHALVVPRWSVSRNSRGRCAHKARQTDTTVRLQLFAELQPLNFFLAEGRASD